MKKILVFLVLLMTYFVSSAQVKDHASWHYSIERINNQTLQIVARVKLDSGWHIYATDMEDGGPQKTVISLKPDRAFSNSTTGKDSGRIISKYDSSFHISLRYFPDAAVFKKIITVTDTSGFDLKGSILYMLCTEEVCLPPAEMAFSMPIPAMSKIPRIIITSDPVSVTPQLNMGSNGSQNKKSYIYIFLAGFLAGLAALLTPCVFPLIPMTVSFFTKRSKTRSEGLRNALTYALSIIIIYVALGFGVSKLFGIDALNALSTNVWFNLVFFVLLVVFAASFLGAFDITLPSALINKVDKQSGKGGLIGIFFMAFTLALVSFSCTGPIVGTLLFESAATGNIGGPFWGMVGFSMALALPFGLFAAFPGWLNSLPKSGGWLNTIKVSLGFLELALALKFLSNADLVVQANIITREVFLVLWIIIFALWGFYLLGKLTFSHDSEVKYLSFGRLSMSILVLSFTLYLIPGLWGAPLKLISGFPPPDFYAEWDHSGLVSGGNTNANNLGAKPTTNHCPNGLNCFHDYDEGIAYAKKENKPVLLDFTGWACVNCRKMESLVWTDERIDKILRNELVLISLYVDDKRELPQAEKTTKAFGGKNYVINTIGNKWSYLQASRFNINSQPYYVLLDTNEQTLAISEGYSSDKEKFNRFLEGGLSKRGK